MRVVFMGTPDFAVPTLNALVEAARHTPLDTGLDPEPLLTCGSPVLGVAVSSGGIAAAGLASGEVVLWDPASCREIRRLRAGRSRASAVDFSPDGRSVAVAAGDGALQT